MSSKNFQKKFDEVALMMYYALCETKHFVLTEVSAIEREEKLWQHL